MEIENLEIIVGTYEEFLLGYRVVKQDNEEYGLVQSFANHSHQASVRSVAAGGKFLASGGADESIILYDMIARKEAGLLMHHRGNVNCLEFSPNGSHLLSGSEDGSIAICRTGSWQLEKLWGAAHKGAAVASLSCHPSGKLMLSVGADATIRTWNLIKGRPAYATGLGKVKEGRSVTQILWSPDGETYAVVVGSRVEIFTVAAASVVHTIQLDTKVTCVCFAEPSLLCAATEEGDVVLHDLDTKTEAGRFKAHDGRVRCVACYGDKWLITASSAGQIKLWRRKDRCRVREICQTSIGCRVTCLSTVTSAPLPPDTKDILVQSALINATLLGDLPSSAATSATRKRPRGIVTVEDPSVARSQTSLAEEDQLGSSDSEEEAAKKEVNRRNRKKKLRKKKRKLELLTLSQEVVDVEDAEVRIPIPADGGRKKGKVGKLVDPETKVMAVKASRRKQLGDQAGSELSPVVATINGSQEAKKARLSKKQVQEVAHVNSNEGARKPRLSKKQNVQEVAQVNSNEEARKPRLSKKQKVQEVAKVNSKEVKKTRLYKKQKVQRAGAPRSASGLWDCE